MRTEHGSWGMEALWKANGAKCVVGIIDTVFIRERNLGQWYFTCKTGEVLRKKKSANAQTELIERFVRIALSNDRNLHGHVCVARRSNGTSYLMDQASMLRMLEVQFDNFKDVIALQPFVCSRGNLGAMYRHEMRTTNDRSRNVYATYKVSQHQMLSNEAVVHIDKAEGGVKSQAKIINNRLNNITLGVAKHIEELQGCRVNEIMIDYIIDDNDQIWLAWIPSVTFSRTNTKQMIEMPSIESEQQDVYGRTGQEALFEEAEEALDHQIASTSPTQIEPSGRASKHFTLKQKSLPDTAASAFPTPFKCSGDFCSYALEEPSQLDSQAALDPLAQAKAQSRRNAHSLFTAEDIEMLGQAKLQELSTIGQLANYSSDRIQFNIMYRSIALAKKYKQKMLEAAVVEPQALPATHKKSYLDSTLSKDIRVNLNKVYGEVEGGTANYYRQVKVCRNCYAVYSMLDASRPLLEAALAKKQQTIENNEDVHATIQKTIVKKTRVPTEAKLPRLAASTSATDLTTGVPTSRLDPPPMAPSASMPQLHEPSSLPRITSPHKNKTRSWRKAKEQVDVTKTFEEFVGLDGYLRGKCRRRKNKELHENSMFPQGLALPEKAATSSTEFMPSILLVEVDQEVIKTIISTLEEYDVQAVCDGAVALKCAQERHFDIVICARDVPSMNGIEFTKLLREHEIQQSIALNKPVKRSPIICFTEHTSAEDLRVYMEVGMDGCLSRPLDVAALTQTVAAAFASLEKPPAPLPSLQAVITKAKANVKLSKPKEKRRRKDISASNPFPIATQTDEWRFAGTYQMDVDTAFPFLIINRPSPPSKINTFFNLVVVHDIFDTLERMQIFLQPILQRYPGAQVLLWNYPGQAFTTWRKGVSLNNVYLASCLSSLLHHVGSSGLKEFRDAPFYLVGYGNGANIALYYTAHNPSKYARAVVSINGFAYVDPSLAAFYHDAMKVFSCSPPTRPDLPVYFHARFLFSGAYLATVSTPLALNLYTAISNPITLDGRMALCLGALSHQDLRELMSKINIPTILIASAQNGLVQPTHVDAIVTARGGLVDSIHRVLTHRRKACVVWVQAGHELFQECKPTMATLFEQLITGFHETNDVFVPSAPPAAPKTTKQTSNQASDVPLSYEDHFINKVMNTMSTIKQEHHTDDATWVAYQQKHQQLTTKTTSKKPTKKTSLDLLFDPMAPAFERETNRVYKAGDGSLIYPDPNTRSDVKEYMNWRVQRNATRLKRMEKAARQIQRAYHAYRARTLAHRMAMNKAALMIQRIYRGSKGRERYHIRKKEDWAVRLVQRTWRGKIGRDAFAQAKAEHFAAIRIESIVRGFLGRQRVKFIRKQRYEGACCIQSLFRRLYAIKLAQRRRLERRSAMNIQRVYRGYVGRKRFATEKDKYLYSKAQTQNIDFGKQMLLEYKLYGTRLQSEVQLLIDEKQKTEATVEALLKEISEFEEGVHLLETEMHNLSKIETEATGVLDEQAKWQLREQKMRLDREFGLMLKKIADRREKLVVLGNTLHQLDQARHAKEEDLRGLERKLLILLEDQQRQLNGIKAKQAKRSQVLLDVVGGVKEPGPLGASTDPMPSPGGNSTVSPEQRQEANALMESTETMMKFGFMSMSMTYFSSMNMIKAMRQIGAHHTFLESAAAIHNHANNGLAASMGAPSPFRAEAAPGNFPGQQPLLVSAWSVNDVGRWLDTMALGTYKQAFSDGTVDGALLYDLNDHDLRYSLGIEHDLHRKKILQAVERLKVAEGITKQKFYPSSAAPSPVGAAPVSPVLSTFEPSIASSPKAPKPVVESKAVDEVDPNAPKIVVKFEELCSMARNGKLKSLKEALERWPDKPFDKLSVKTPFIEGAGTQYEESLERLAFHMNKTDDHGNTLLILAAQNNLLKVVQFFLSKGANINHQNNQGQTAGHYAMAYNFFDLGAWILDPDKGGGRDDILNINGLTAYDGLG